MQITPNFWFDVPKVDEAILECDKTIQLMDWIAKMRADLSLVYRALYNEQARQDKCGNRKLEDYQFKVWNGILINQRKHH